MKKQKLRMQHRAARLVARVIDWDKRIFDRAAKTVESIQDRSEKAVQRSVSEAKWVPKEGKELVGAWIHTVRRGRRDLRKTVDTSLALTSDFFRRIGEPAMQASRPAPKPRKRRAPMRKSAPSAAATAS